MDLARKLNSLEHCEIDQRPKKKQRQKYGEVKFICESEKCPKYSEKWNKPCGHKFTRQHDLTTHLSKIRFECEYCKKTCSTKGDLDLHKLKKHQIPRPGTPQIPTPQGYDDKVFKFIKDTVKDCIENDKKKYPELKNISEYQKNKINQTKHDLADLIYQRDYVGIEKTEKDNLGGNCELIFRPQSGIFQCSLDNKTPRIDNKTPGTPHFRQNEPENHKDKFHRISNVQMIPFGMNTASNVSNIYLEKTTAFLRQKVKESATKKQEEKDQAIEFQKKKYFPNKFLIGKLEQNTLYGSCASSYQRDEKCNKSFKKSFKDLDSYFKHCHQLLVKQNYCCAISRIFFENNGKWNPLQLSVDAIDPTLGHVPGNIRIIILCLNCTCRVDRMNPNIDYGDHPTQWTTSLFFNYISV